MTIPFIDKILSDRVGRPSINSSHWKDSSTIVVDRNDGTQFTTSFIRKAFVAVEDVLACMPSSPDLISSVPKDAVWDGAAISYCEEAGVGWGSIGSFLDVCHGQDARTKSDKYTFFARRLMRQIRTVRSVSYVNSLLFQVSLHSGASLRVAVINSYDLSSDDVRTAWDMHGSFDAAYKNNPNGSITSDAHDAARDLGVIILDKSTVTDFLRAR